MKFKKAIKTINRICAEHDDGNCTNCPFHYSFHCIALGAYEIKENSRRIEKICKKYWKNHKKG
jgi:hypothetical protein